MAYVIFVVLWSVSVFIVFWAMVGYPVFLCILDKIKKPPQIQKDYSFMPTTTVLVVAHNEEKVILEKLNNIINIDYPRDKLSIMVTSDCSTDRTNEIVERFILDHKQFDIRLHKTIKHGGKTNAQNEAVKLIKSDLIVMTDANCMFDKNAVKEIAACFKNPKIKYVCGATVYTNSKNNRTADSENRYWDIDSKCRDIESRVQTITAGDGNLYACRADDYKEIPLIECHDSSFPVLFALEGGKAVFDSMAVTYEKAGENDKDEYKRKVRMNRNIIHNILPSISILNIFKCKWFTVFWLSHRTCRYLLWIAHLCLLIISGVLFKMSFFWKLVFLGQCVFYIISIMGIVFKSNNRVIKLMSYYTMTIMAQWHGVYNIITGKSKPTWAKAESTR